MLLVKTHRNLPPSPLWRSSAAAAAAGLGCVNEPARRRKEAQALRSFSALTLTAALVCGQLVAGVAGALVAAQRVDTALLAATVVRLGTLVHLWNGEQGRLGPYRTVWVCVRARGRGRVRVCARSQK